VEGLRRLMSYKLAKHDFVTFTEHVVPIHKHITLLSIPSISGTKTVTKKLTKRQRWSYLTTPPLHIYWIFHGRTVTTAGAGGLEKILPPWKNMLDVILKIWAPLRKLFASHVCQDGYGPASLTSRNRKNAFRRLVPHILLNSNQFST